MSERKIELTWVCTSCHHRNRGRDKVCAGCGDPKDASERFEMPSDTASAASVADPKLLDAARAGADWRCAFCRADNRALDPACRRCGAQRGTTPANTDHLRPVPRGAAQPPRGAMPVTRAGSPAGSAVATVLTSSLAVIGVGLVGFGCIVGGFVLWAARRPSTRPLVPADSIVEATVTGRSWEASLTEQRSCLAPAEGFAEQEPPDAVEVVADGVRHHHDDRIEDGTELETYFEDVPYQETETYTELVPCGQDCVDLPQSCSESCTDDGNGFATCSTTCTGGGQTCTPRTCPETRTRMVTRTRQEPRTRTVPHYRIEPRDAPWFRWRAHAWRESGTARRAGTDAPPARPTEADLEAGTAVLEDCRGAPRLERSERAEVVLTTESGHEVRVRPSSLDELSRFELGARVRVELDPGGGFSRLAP